MNLLQETISTLQAVGKDPKKVSWVGLRGTDRTLTWKQFEKLAHDLNYDPNYEDFYIHKDLVVVGQDWWLEREAHGLERWTFHQRPVKPKTKRLLTDLISLFAESYDDS